MICYAKNVENPATFVEGFWPELQAPGRFMKYSMCEYFWTLVLHKNQFHTSKFAKTQYLSPKWLHMAQKWHQKGPLSICTKVPLVGTLNVF